jgi:hypothetical protein
LLARFYPPGGFGEREEKVKLDCGELQYLIGQGREPRFAMDPQIAYD